MAKPFFIPKRLTLAEMQAAFLSIARLMNTVSVSDLPAMTLAQLNSIISDADLDDKNETRTPKVHASTHVPGGTDDLMSRFMAMDEAGLMADENGTFMQMF